MVSSTITSIVVRWETAHIALTLNIDGQVRNHVVVALHVGQRKLHAMDSFRSSSILFAVFILLFVFHVCDAAAVQNSTPNRRNDVIRREQSCDIPGNTDLYGFGVRLGIIIDSATYLCPFLMHSRYIFPTVNIISRKHDVR